MQGPRKAALFGGKANEDEDSKDCVSAYCADVAAVVCWRCFWWRTRHDGRIDYRDCDERRGVFLLRQNRSEIERRGSDQPRGISAALRGYGTPGGQSEFTGTEAVSDSASRAKRVRHRTQSQSRIG